MWIVANTASFFVNVNIIIYVNKKVSSPKLVISSHLIVKTKYFQSF